MLTWLKASGLAAKLEAFVLVLLPQVSLAPDAVPKWHLALEANEADTLVARKLRLTQVAQQPWICKRYHRRCRRRVRTALAATFH